jgi:alpha-1,6-mannosyltransferase
LVVLVLLSPVALPWYYSWSLAVAAGLALSRRTLVLVVGLSTWLMLVYQPAGDTALYIWPQVLGAVAAGLLAAWLLVRDMAQDVAQGVTHDRHL